MKGRLGVRTLFAAALTIAFMAAAAGTAHAAPGDVYVVDRGADELWKFPSSGGDATSLSSFPGASPYGLTLGPDGFLYVADEAGPVWRVDRNTGAKSPVVDIPEPTNPIDVAFDPRGRLHVVDYDNNSISRVDLGTGAMTPVVSPSASSGFNTMAFKRDGSFFVSDESEGAVYSFTPQGVRSTLLDATEVSDADGLFLTPDERYLYVGSYARSTYERFDLSAGTHQTLPTSGPPYNTAMTLDGRLIYPNDTNSDVEYADLGGVFGGTFSSDPDLATPRGIVVEPPPCGGKVPTVVGTPGADALRGSNFADVFLTQGGKDKIVALGGNDVVCAGAGKDVVKGGPGNDTLIGQSGNDKLIGGKGKDKVKGGKGKDTEKP